MIGTRTKTTITAIATMSDRKENRLTPVFFCEHPTSTLDKSLPRLTPGNADISLNLPAPGAI